MFICVKKIVNFSYQFFSKEKKCKKYLCFINIRVLQLYVLTCFFIRFGGMEVQEELHI